jgi:hypothetical protein
MCFSNINFSRWHIKSKDLRKQIRNGVQNKKATIFSRLRICYIRMVRSVDKRWNTLYPDILHLVQGLERLGLEYRDGEVSYTGLENRNV